MQRAKTHPSSCLIPIPPTTFNHGPRPFKDIPFIFVAATFSFGIFSVFHRNSASSVSSYSYSSSSSSCVSSSSPSLLRALIIVLVLTAILSLPIFSLLRRYAKQLVYVSLPFFLLLPVFFNVYWFAACTISSSCSDAFPLAYKILVLVFVFLIIGVFIWIFVVNWHMIELTIRNISVASDALSRNLGIFGVFPFMSLGLVVYYVPIVRFLVYARQSGSIEPMESDGEYSFVWKQDSWVPACFAVAVLTMLWSLTGSVEARVYLISGTIAQWYFSKEEDSPPRKSIRRSLRNAFGSSSGTICLSGLLNCIVRMVRAAVDSTKIEDASGFVDIVMRCCMNIFLSAVDFVNKFTIAFAAMTGESYCASARMTYELLRRNLLSAAFVETISPRLLGGIIFVFSAIYAIVVCATVKGAGSL